MKRVAFSEDCVLSEGNRLLCIRIGVDKVAPVLRWTANGRCPDILDVRNLVGIFVRRVHSFDVVAETLMFQRGRARRGSSAGGGRAGLGHGRSRCGGRRNGVEVENGSGTNSTYDVSKVRRTVKYYGQYRTRTRYVSSSSATVPTYRMPK